MTTTLSIHYQCCHSTTIKYSFMKLRMGLFSLRATKHAILLSMQRYMLLLYSLHATLRANHYVLFMF